MTLCCCYITKLIFGLLTYHSLINLPCSFMMGSKESASAFGQMKPTWLSTVTNGLTRSMMGNALEREQMSLTQCTP